MIKIKKAAGYWGLLVIVGVVNNRGGGNSHA